MNINNIINKVTGYVKEKKQERETYNRIVDNSLLFELDKVINSEKDICEGNVTTYKGLCVYLNDSKAELIDKLISLDETVICIAQIEQQKDNKIFYLVLTDLRVLIINDNMYKDYNYNEIKTLELINKSLLTQIINFNGIILGIDVNGEDLNKIYNLIINAEYRNNYVNDFKKYLCGIKPIYQVLNKINSGISIDINNNIVFHNKKVNNYLCRYNDILNYEILEDNTSVLRKKTGAENNKMPFSKKECMQMAIRVTLVNNQVFEIIILEPNTFNSTYSHTNSIYINNYNFAKSIIDKLDELN